MRRSWIIIENNSVLGGSDAAVNEIRLREIYAGKELSECEIENIARMFYCRVEWQQTKSPACGEGLEVSLSSCSSISLSGIR